MKGERAVLWGVDQRSLAFWCPGCDAEHCCGVKNTGDARPIWTWNDDLDRPTLQPSVLIRTGRAVDPNFQPEPGDPPEVCHSYVTDGRIQFLSDCTHGLAGQTVDLPRWPR
ncbi:MAG: ammonia monooxygenase [Alphaproteobacteria bacterium]|nr:MAG: ammonia monooxygenase [Alphaproteobacteria bacterium]